MSTRTLLATADRSAIISPCGIYRYWLGRRWADGPTLLFVMLNPSTADADVDDATIRRCTGFAHAHDFGALEVVNLFAFRATDPRDLWRSAAPVGPNNNSHILEAIGNAKAVCVAWGAQPKAERRVQEVLPLIYRAGMVPQALRITRSGYPQHPLMLPSICRLHPFTLDAVQEAMTP